MGIHAQAVSGGRLHDRCDHVVFFFSRQSVVAELTHDEHRGFNVLSTQIVSVAEQKALEEKTLEDYKDAGVQNFFAQLGETEIEKEELQESQEGEQ